MNILQQTVSPFDTIRRVHNGNEYWSARDLQPLLGYAKWERFHEAISRAIESCENNAPSTASDHFPAAGKLVEVGSGAERTVLDYHLSRHACYLIAMNGDPRKPEIAAAQMYFAVQTQRAEQAQAAALTLPDDPLLAQLEILKQVRVSQLQLEHRTGQVEQVTAALQEKLDSVPITSEKVGRIHRLGQQLGQLMGDYSRAWRLFKDRFGLASYRDLPSNRFDEAVRFLQLQIASYTGQPSLLEDNP